MNIVEEIIQLFATRGDSAYIGEAVSQREHALQAAALAEQDGASDSLVVAALLHDIGHLLHNLPENSADQGIDTTHETVGDTWLQHAFGPEITEPVRLHVAAKRYLCAVKPEYQAQLSTASVQSLLLQGGPMNADEVHAFESNPHYRDAIRLRRWDDLAKEVNLQVPDVEHYRSRLTALLHSAPNEARQIL